MSTSQEQAPPVYPVHAVEISAAKSGKISSVSVYTGRAEITRVFRVNLKAGQNEVVINNLPNVMDEPSLRVEGRGAATIHDVSVSYIPRPVPVTSSPALTALLAKKNRVEKAIVRCQKSIQSLETYLGSMHIQHIEVSNLGGVMKGYDSAAEELDLRLLELETERSQIEEELEAERARLSTLTEYNELLSRRATIGVFSDVEAEVELTLIYAVYGASWTALYDIRVNMQTKDAPVVMTYKASIEQNTGEDWKDVSLVLETATPTFGVEVPKLDPWTLSLYQPSPYQRPTLSPMMMPPPPAPLTRAAPGSAVMAFAAAPPPPPQMATREAGVSSKGNVSATFQVPGVISIPSDGASHNVTIAELNLEATMVWLCVPKKDTKTRLSARIKNTSEYTLLRGKSSVYIDGSFVSRIDVPPVSPEERFDIPLGLDPTIRVTYHPQTRKKGQSGFYNKTVHHVFTQNVTVHNTKAIPVDGVKIVDQFPVSEDTQIQVKHVNPTLSATAGTNGVTADITRRAVTIAKGVSAIWDGADDEDVDAETLGKSGKFNWICSIPPQGKINLTLQWEVAVPPKTDIVGLMLGVCSP